MIQRIQSLYLLMAGILSAICAYLCLNGIVPGQYTPGLKGEQFTALGSAACIVEALLSLVTIFLYKNRKRQMRVCWVGILVTLAAAALYIWVLAAALFILIAWRCIRADERLIRSIDRIR